MAMPDARHHRFLVRGVGPAKGEIGRRGAEFDGGQMVVQQVTFAAHDQSPSLKIQLKHVQRIGGGNTQALALAHRVVDQAPMSAQHLALLVDDIARQGRRCALLAGEKKSAVALGYKTQFLAVLLLGHGQAQLARGPPHLGLVIPAQRKNQTRKQRRRDAMQEITLILARVQAAQQAGVRALTSDAGVVPGGGEGAPLPVSQPHQFGKAHGAIAIQTGVWCFGLAVVGHEGIDDPRAKGLFDIAHPMGRTIAEGQPPRLFDGVKRAARLFGRCDLSVSVAKILESHTLDFASERLEQRQGHRAVHSSAEAQQNPGARRQLLLQVRRNIQRKGHCTAPGSGAFIRSSTILMLSRERSPISPSGSYLEASSHSVMASR